jgi:hypothetical protein
MNFLKYLKLLPEAIAIAKAIEAEIPFPQSGKQKLDAGLAVAGQAFDIEESLRSAWGDKATFIGAITKAITPAVTLLNSLGVFKTANAPATA